ncbi:membrane protein [Corynebacterium phocae]|uniref:Membrane protein n=1 Tax=Corynebacterium phocae TaxID=161895 RepID=A0A1L7D3Z2_9CORY|nr:hypothetical protein [Corynebacterium phocae]APT92825.1 membrane protein [Corynebacterium phocae]KAA8723142.1 hypothetical protein F4V58_07415 [Corynebacterium phocae]
MTGEKITALVWLSLGAVMSLLLEVIYLRARLPLGGGHTVAFPITIAVAFAFNMVLTKTARLWSSHPAIGAVPLSVWTVGFCGFFLAGDLGSVQALGASAWAAGLFMAGILGGVWPFFSEK